MSALPHHVCFRCTCRKVKLKLPTFKEQMVSGSRRVYKGRGREGRKWKGTERKEREGKGGNGNGRERYGMKEEGRVGKGRE